MDVIRIDGDFCPADVRVVELVDSLHSQVASIEAENTALKTTLEDVRLFLGASYDLSFYSSDMINQINGALARARAVKE